MTEPNLFPDLSKTDSKALSEDNNVRIDGMTVKFDIRVTNMPVKLSYKEKKTQLTQPYERIRQN